MHADVRLPTMNDTLRDRIAAVLGEHVEDQLTNYDAERNECGCGTQGLIGYKEHVADAVIEALDDDFVDFGLWLAEEITGRTMTRIDLESCLADWKGSRDDDRQPPA